MSLMKIIEARINEIPEGEFFTIDTLLKNLKKEGATKEAFASSKALSRLYMSGVVSRYKKGIYYKPKKTILGNLKPSESKEIELLAKDGYVTGSTIYNEWGLTTQISNEVVIASDKPKRAKFINNDKVKVRYVIGIKPKKERDIPKLQLLDVLKRVKEIPDRDDKALIVLLKERIRNYKNEELDRLIQLAKEYNPATRAFLGAILELLKLNSYTKELKETLNKLSVFKIPISDEALPNKQNWQII